MSGSKVQVAMPVEWVIEQEEIDSTLVRRGEVDYLSQDGDKFRAQFPLSPDNKIAGNQMAWMLGQKSLQDSEET